MIEVTFFFFLGLFIGSFLLVLIDRIPRNESFVNSRSHCEHCRHILAWYDLFPLVSFIMLSGKCRYCHNKLSLSYPLVELLTGMLFALTYFYFSSTSNLLAIIYYLVLVSGLIVIFFVDLKARIIPFVILLPMIALVSLFTLFTNPYSFLWHLLSGCGAAIFFLLIFFCTSRKGMGFGDVVYAFFMGMLLGYPRIVTGLYLAFVFGAVIGLIFLVLQKKKLHGASIPFGPFLVLGTVAGLLIEQHFFLHLIGLY